MDRGIVVTVGPGMRDDAAGVLRPVGIEEGEVVVFAPYAGSKVVVGGIDYLLLREHDVLGILDGG